METEQGRRFLEGLPRPIIADVGSGNHPFPLANLLIDLYPEDNRHREHGAALVRDHRPFFQADVQDLPFPDQSIDFIWCAEVVEHCDDPVAAFHEICRVAIRAYVLVPTYSREMCKSSVDPEGWSTHKWCFLNDDGTLRVFDKQERLADGALYVGNSEHLVIPFGIE